MYRQVRTEMVGRHNMGTKPQARHENYKLPACPVEATLEMIGGKWKGVILYYLLDKRLRFSELKRKVGTVTQRMLTSQNLGSDLVIC